MANESSPILADGLVYANGAFRASADACVSVFDHGLLYGDGVFEGIRAYNGRVFKLDRHIERLFDSAKAILRSHGASVAAVERRVNGTHVQTSRADRRIGPHR